MTLAAHLDLSRCLPKYAAAVEEAHTYIPPPPPPYPSPVALPAGTHELLKLFASSHSTELLLVFMQAVMVVQARASSSSLWPTGITWPLYHGLLLWTAEQEAEGSLAIW
jgi:hypothetical protein